MELTRFTDYCLRVLMFLNYRQDRLTTIADLSRGYKISSNHLMKVVHHLAQLNYIETVRGKGGGMRLARRPEDIRLSQIVRDCEPTTSLIECMDEGYEGDCPLMPRCRLRSILMGAQKVFLDHLDQFTLQDLTSSRHVRQALHPLRFVEPGSS